MYKNSRAPERRKGRSYREIGTVIVRLWDWGGEDWGVKGSGEEHMNDKVSKKRPKKCRPRGRAGSIGRVKGVLVTGLPDSDRTPGGWTTIRGKCEGYARKEKMIKPRETDVRYGT